jgi:hypothetical protein
MVTNVILPQKYAGLGFTISRFGKTSLALRWQDKTIFVFDSATNIRVGDDFVSGLCNFYLQHAAKEKIESRN